MNECLFNIVKKNHMAVRVRLVLTVVNTEHMAN